MIEFRQKQFTIQEGRYIGPKEENKVPGAIEVIGKSALGGSIIGGIVGKIDKDSTIGQGMLGGAKYGTLAGIVLKFFLNYLHNPMSSVKYQEVDRVIRREFGIHRAAGITIGDKLSTRNTLDQKFSFNDRKITDYKISVCVQDNRVTLYTYDITTQELDQLSKTLDYYCMKYYGMNYESHLINQRLNSYAVAIVFTNYQVISNFLMEVSEVLKYRINLLDNKALVESRLINDERQFSVKDINKYELIDIFAKSIPDFNTPKPITPVKSITGFVLSVIKNSVYKTGVDEIYKNTGGKGVSGFKMKREDLGNSYLETILKKLHYVEGFSYTVDKKTAKNNIALVKGLLIITVEKDSEEAKKLDELQNNLKSQLKRAQSGKVIVYTNVIKSASEFEHLIKRLMSTRIKFNIFEG